jgi:hypothetical protein
MRSFVFCSPLPDAVKVCKGRAMAQAVSRRRLTTEVRVRDPVIHVGFVVIKVALGQVSLRYYPLNIIPPWLSMLMYHVGDEQ